MLLLGGHHSANAFFCPYPRIGAPIKNPIGLDEPYAPRRSLNGYFIAILDSPGYENSAKLYPYISGARSLQIKFQNLQICAATSCKLHDWPLNPMCDTSYRTGGSVQTSLQRRASTSIARGLSRSAHRLLRTGTHGLCPHQSVCGCDDLLLAATNILLRPR